MGLSGSCGLREPPVEYCGHVAGGLKVASGGGCPEVEEWVLTGFNRQREQVCSQGRPRRLAGEFRNDLVSLAVERMNDLGANQLLGRDMGPVGVALDGVEEPLGWVTELAQQLVAEAAVSSRASICRSSSVGVRGAMVSGRMRVCGSPSPTTCRYK